MQGEKLEQLTCHRNHCVAKDGPVSSSVPSSLGATGKEDKTLLLESLGIAAEFNGQSVTSLSSCGSQVRGNWTRSKLGVTLLRSVIELYCYLQNKRLYVGLGPGLDLESDPGWNLPSNLGSNLGSNLVCIFADGPSADEDMLTSPGPTAIPWSNGC